MPSNAASLSQSDVDAACIRAVHKQGAPPPPPVSDQPALPDGVENLCPHGCDTSELSEIGHCRHLVGFTSNGKTYEPQKKRMRPAREADGKIIRDEDGKIQYDWDGSWITDAKDAQ